MSRGRAWCAVVVSAACAAPAREARVAEHGALAGRDAARARGTVLEWLPASELGENRATAVVRATDADGATLFTWGALRGRRAWRRVEWAADVPRYWIDGAARVRGGWAFVAHDGEVFTSAEFTGPLRFVARVDAVAGSASGASAGTRAARAAAGRATDDVHDHAHVHGMERGQVAGTTGASSWDSARREHALEQRDVEQVLRAARGALVREEVLERDHARGRA